jgi:hypothetical protein
MSLDYHSELQRATSVHRVLPLQQHLLYFSATSDVFLVILLEKIIGPLIILGSYTMSASIKDLRQECNIYTHDSPCADFFL